MRRFYPYTIDMDDIKKELRKAAETAENTIEINAKENIIKPVPKRTTYLAFALLLLFVLFTASIFFSTYQVRQFQHTEPIDNKALSINIRYYLFLNSIKINNYTDEHGHYPPVLDSINIDDVKLTYNVQKDFYSITYSLDTISITLTSNDDPMAFADLSMIEAGRTDE